MDDAGPPRRGSLEHALSDGDAELDLMDELLSGKCWLDTTECSDFLQPGTPTFWSPFGSSGFSPLFEASNSCLDQIPPETSNRGRVGRLDLYVNQNSDEIQLERVEGAESHSVNAIGIPKYPIQTEELDSRNPNTEPGTSWWIQPGDPVISVKERLGHALSYIKEFQGYGDVLVQIWVPVKIGERQVLTTFGQPFSLDITCQSLVNYRTISMGYQFPAEEGSNEVKGLPGRVFLGRVPEWTPDVHYFSSDEYPRVNDAQRCDVHGTIALPIFERGSRSCLGVVELVTTAQKINYSSEIENMCNALQAVDLRSSEFLSIPHIKVSNNSYKAALPEIREVLRIVCNTHRLPLAQTWISCIHQGKKGSRHSDENYKECVSTVDDACYVNDHYMLRFHEACSEHHLFRGQGVVGKAFTTNQPCFSSDIASFSKIEYPLSHHAKLFHLRAAVAIRLRSVHTGIADFVLEFFLPVDCRGNEEQKLMLNSLSATIQQTCQSLRIVTTKELEDEAVLQANERIPSNVSFGKYVYGEGDSFLSAGTPKGASQGESSWVASVVETQQNEISSTLKFDEQETEKFSISANCEMLDVVRPAGEIFTEFEEHQRDLVKDILDDKDSFSGDPRILNSGKVAEKRHTKTEKTVSLQVLRQHFSGSLKDAAKNIGVCPTTLKRICRQHGITRWPSRKIQKVGHSLRKLQVVIDSVQGAQGAFQFSSLYENFTKASGTEKDLSDNNSFSILKQKDDPEGIIAHQQVHTSASNSLSSSSCSQSSSSGLACSSETKQCSHAQLTIKQEAPLEDNQSGNMFKRADGLAEEHTEEQLESMSKSKSHKFLSTRLSSRSLSPMHKKRHEMFKVKAMYREDKIRFKLHPTWGFQDLKQEILERFSISNIESVDLKYLDDDAEWVLLTCDADLQECIDVYKATGVYIIKMSVHVTHPAFTTTQRS